MNRIPSSVALLLVVGFASSVMAADTPGAAATPVAQPTPKTDVAVKTDAATQAPAATKTDASKDATKDTAKKTDPKAEPAAPSLAPGAVGDLAMLKEHFPALNASAKPDGTTVIDDRFAIKGKGTLEDPFIVTWDQLTSASEVYDPRKGQKKIPDRVQMLDGQFVTVTGYVAFPIYVKEPKEMLSMLNQWDGCCIGVPPTPYDAIEVHLKDPATKEQRMATYGTVSGRLSVKPYLVGDWLVGLYVMDEAVVSKPKQTGSGS